MEMFYNVMELLFAFVEGVIVFSVSGSMCRRKYKNAKHIVLIMVFSVFYTLLITYINTFTEHMGLVLLSALCCSFAVNLLISKASMLLRWTSIITIWFFLHALDYVLAYGFLFVGEKYNINENYFTVLNIAAEVIKISVFCFMRRVYPLFSSLSKKYLGLILSISSGAYLIMYYFAGVMMGESVTAVRMAFFFSILFTVVSLIATVFAVTVKMGYEKEKREAELMAMTNTMLEKNFFELENSHNTIRQQVHDFKNHLLTLRGMLEKDERAKGYIEELLHVSYDNAQLCACGNSVIDSILNCKIAEAKRQCISFTHKVMLSSQLHISPVDICAVLANQIDNAIEACMKLSNNDEKKIKVEIWQKESFVFFKVINNCRENPFNGNNELVSTKNDPSGLHGYGIKNITKTTESYGGTMKSRYADGEFISVAMLPNNKH